ncbi:MAG: hypothetical protein ACM3WQ_06660 [Chloroflexota bacterium]|nr:hypothetical protein [Candidatus Sulfotelmatobacter sp.]
MEEQVERLGSLKPKEKIALCIDMTDTCIQICAASIQQQNPNISQEELIEQIRQRLVWTKRHRRKE